MKHNTDTLTIGLDLGDKAHEYYIIDAEGTEVAEGKVSNKPDSLSRWARNYPGAKIIMETGSHSPWLSRFFTKQGHPVLVANARKTRAIWGDDRKSDQRDARMLARLGRVDPALLHPIRHCSEQTQRDMALLKARDILVRTRSSLISATRGVLKSLGIDLPTGCSAESFERKASALLNESERALVTAQLELIKVANEEIKLLDGKITTLIRERYPIASHLQQIHGVGPITALCFVLTIESPQRFKDNRQVGAYLGLVPRRDQSGQRDKQLRIAKAGNGYMRRLLVSCAHYILGPFGQPSALREHGLRIAERGGSNARKRAIVAVARKLAVVLIALWKRPEATYNPLPQAA